MIKSLADVNKGGTFAPATTQCSQTDWQEKLIKREKKFSKKRLEKACGNEKRILHLHPANTESSLRY
jgi:hypothetical protein